MRKITGLGLGLFLLLGAPAAIAQTAPPASLPAPALSPKDRADAILNAAQATDLFENITTGNVAEIRHKASGLECGFDDAPTARVTVFPNAVRGNDVACGSKTQDVLISIYATKLSPDAKLEDVFRQTLTDMRPIFPDMKSYDGTVATITSDAELKSLTTYFVFNDKDGRVTGKVGADVISRVSIAMTKDGWMLKLRASTPKTDDQSGMKLSVMASLMWSGTLLKFTPEKSERPAS